MSSALPRSSLSCAWKAMSIPEERINPRALELRELAEDDELREIWRARNAFGHDGDVLQWLATLPDPLRHRAEHLGRSVELPKEYLLSSEAMECVTIVQREIAKRWNTRLPRMLASTVDDAEADTLYARVADIQQYLNRLMTPKRSSTFDDLHTRHSNT
jgi:DNA primase